MFLYVFIGSKKYHMLDPHGFHDLWPTGHSSRAGTSVTSNWRRMATSPHRHVATRTGTLKTSGGANLLSKLASARAKTGQELKGLHIYWLYILIIYINYIFIYNSDFDWKICSEVFQGFSKNVLLRFLEVFHQFLDELNWNSRQVMELWRWRIANARAIFTNRLWILETMPVPMPMAHAIDIGWNLADAWWTSSLDTQRSIPTKVRPGHDARVRAHHNINSLLVQNVFKSSDLHYQMSFYIIYLLDVTCIFAYLCNTFHDIHKWTVYIYYYYILLLYIIIFFSHKRDHTHCEKLSIH